MTLGNNKWVQNNNYNSNKNNNANNMEVDNLQNFPTKLIYIYINCMF